MEGKQGKYRPKKDREDSRYDKPRVQQRKRPADRLQIRRIDRHRFSNIPQVRVETANIVDSVACSARRFCEGADIT